MEASGASDRRHLFNRNGLAALKGRKQVQCITLETILSIRRLPKICPNPKCPKFKTRAQRGKKSREKGTLDGSEWGRWWKCLSGVRIFDVSVRT